MNNEVLGFILTCISGFSTLLGFFIIFLKKDHSKLLSSSLYFASGVMLCVSILDLIPSSYFHINSYYFVIFSILLVILFMVIGIIISMLIDKFLPDNNDNIYHLGIMTMLVIILHNLPEGIITYITSANDIKLGLSLTLAISLHNIPEGISIAVPIYYSTKSYKKAFLYTFISALSEPLGAVISYLFLSKYIDNLILGLLFSMIAGIMIHISCYELIPNAKKYSKKNNTIYFLIGWLVMLISLLI